MYLLNDKQESQKPRVLLSVCLLLIGSSIVYTVGGFGASVAQKSGI
jgi:hypothetical protein